MHGRLHGSVSLAAVQDDMVNSFTWLEQLLVAVESLSCGRGWMSGEAIYTASQKKETPYSYPYLHQILTHFKNSFTGTLYRKLAVKR